MKLLKLKWECEGQSGISINVFQFSVQKYRVNSELPFNIYYETVQKWLFLHKHCKVKSQMNSYHITAFVLLCFI